MSRSRFVDARWVKSRMDRKDARVARQLRAQLRPVPAPTPVAPPVEITGDPAAWHAFLAHPATGAQLDALLEDFAAIDQAEAEAAARLELERDDDDAGWACSTACGFCGRCSA